MTLAEMRLGETVTQGEVWPLHLAWLRYALRDGPLTRRQIGKDTGKMRWMVDRDAWQAEQMGLVTRGDGWTVRLVNQEKR